MRALFVSPAILRAVCFTSEPSSEDSAIFLLLQRSQAVLVCLSPAFPVALRASPQHRFAQWLQWTQNCCPLTEELEVGYVRLLGSPGSSVRHHWCPAGIFLWKFESSGQACMRHCGQEPPRLAQPGQSMSAARLFAPRHPAHARDELQGSRIRLAPSGNSSWNFFPQ